jgi:hypothetical protein
LPERAELPQIAANQCGQKSETLELLAKVRNLPFDRLRVNGLRFKLFSFSVRGELVEPQKNTFARAPLIPWILFSSLLLWRRLRFSHPRFLNKSLKPHQALR